VGANKVKMLSKKRCGVGVEELAITFCQDALAQVHRMYSHVRVYTDGISNHFECLGIVVHMEVGDDNRTLISKVCVHMKENVSLFYFRWFCPKSCQYGTATL